MDISGRKQIYFDAMVNGTTEADELLNQVFNVNPAGYVFRHEDCPIVFITDGHFLYAMDMDDKDTDIVSEYGAVSILNYYNDPREFVTALEYIQRKLERVIPIMPLMQSYSVVYNVNPMPYT